MRSARGKERIRLRSGHAQVAELLRARGVPRSLRQRYPVLEAAGEVVWVPGVRSAPFFPGTAASTLGRARLEVDPGHSWEAFLLARVIREQRTPGRER